MECKKRVLSFPPDMVEEPVTYNLITRYGIRVNILRASIDPGKQGRMVVELGAEESQMARGLNYLESLGVTVESLADEIRHDEARCTSCTACIPHCPTGALEVDRQSRQVVFRPEQCIACRSCVDVCIYRAVDAAGY